MALTPIIELGVAEAYAILTEHFGVIDLPPLEAIENEDWGRDYLLSRFLERSATELADAGLSAAVEQAEDRDCTSCRLGQAARCRPVKISASIRAARR
jgi:hypothetical protein